MSADMIDTRHFYIDGQWVAPNGTDSAEIINPATEEQVGSVALGNVDDADAAIAAAKAAFEPWSRTSREERLAYLRKISAALIERNDEIANAISLEMGAPSGLARRAQAPSGRQHFEEIIRVLETFAFEEVQGSTLLRHEPVGVCVLITPWNWPMNQIAAKVAPALAAGCTMVLKPSELAPLDAVILAEIIDKAGLPKGVFNLVHGTGPVIGDVLTRHLDVDMVSFTGSTRAGIAISINASPTVKRVALELGGKSANIILPDADLEMSVSTSVRSCMQNSGQSCNAPTRLLVHRSQLAYVNQLAIQAASSLTVDLPANNPDLGPIANRAQYHRVIAMIDQAVSEGSELITGGVDRPEDLAGGFFVRPTIFSNVTADMMIAREEVFGPVLVIIPYNNIQEAIQIANASQYGLSSYVWGADEQSCKAVAAILRTGMVHINGAPLDTAAPFGGYKMSGNGREWGIYGLREFLEVKSVYGGA
jgi:aldehyde dehydrogenase (NAD+)